MSKASENIYEEPDTHSTESIYGALQKIVSKEIRRETLLMGRLLGDGQFGQVFAGEYRAKSDSKALKVAIKMLRPDETNPNLIVEFLREAAIQGQWSHPNIIGLVGYVTVTEPPIIVIERADETLGECVKRKTSPVGTMVVWMSQMASAMCYLSSRAYIHRDLACRNVLMVKGVAKIADFGRSRSISDTNAIYQTSNGVVPIRWTAPEALESGKYSVLSDIWSFGILLYEMFTKGTRPYSESWSNHDVYTRLVDGYRLPPPPGCPKIVYRLMFRCWHPTNSSRPSFPAIKTVIAMFESSELQDVYEDRNTPISPGAAEPAYAVPSAKEHRTSGGSGATSPAEPISPTLPPRAHVPADPDEVYQYEQPNGSTNTPLYSLTGEVADGHSLDDIGSALYSEISRTKKGGRGTMDRGSGDGSFMKMVSVKDALKDSDSPPELPPARTKKGPELLRTQSQANALQKRTSKWMSEWESRRRAGPKSPSK